MISIITVAFNAKEQLNKTLESVLAQRCDNDVQFTGCECIVVDGGSTDGSAELLEGYRDRFAKAGIHFDARSEKDNGIYDGMNKGITRAAGDWVYFLNAGDVLYDKGVLQLIEGKLADADKDGIDIVYGDVCSIAGDVAENAHTAENENDHGAGNAPGSDTQRHIMRSSGDINVIKKNLPFCHQAVFTRRSLHDEMMYSLNYRLAADYELFLKAYTKGAAFRYIPVVVAEFALDGASNRNRKQLFLEYERIHKEYGLAKRGIAGALLHVWGLFKIAVAGIIPDKLVYGIMEKRINRK